MRQRDIQEASYLLSGQIKPSVEGRIVVQRVSGEQDSPNASAYAVAFEEAYRKAKGLSPDAEQIDEQNARRINLVTASTRRGSGTSYWLASWVRPDGSVGERVYGEQVHVTRGIRPFSAIKRWLQPSRGEIELTTFTGSALPYNERQSDLLGALAYTALDTVDPLVSILVEWPDGAKSTGRRQEVRGWLRQAQPELNKPIEVLRLQDLQAMDQMQGYLRSQQPSNVTGA